MIWHDMKWTDISALDKQLPVVIPLGSCEQHGRHLPLLVDTIQVSEIAKRAEAALSDRVLLLPTLWLGSSHHHMDFPGTLSVPPLCYAQIIKEIAKSVLRSGFKRLVFLNGHGGNTAPASTALTDLVAEDDNADAACIAFASWWELGRPGMLPDKLGLKQSAMSHACEYETSVMLVLRPDLVNVGQITTRPPVLNNAWVHSEDDSKTRVRVFRRFHRITAEGFMGRPDLASVEKGNAILDGVTQQITDFLTDYTSWPELPAIGPGNGE